MKHRIGFTLALLASAMLQASSAAADMLPVATYPSFPEVVGGLMFVAVVSGAALFMLRRMMKANPSDPANGDALVPEDSATADLGDADSGSTREQ